MSITVHPAYGESRDPIESIIQWLSDHDQTEAADAIRYLRAREIETQEALQKIGEEFGLYDGELLVAGIHRVLTELREDRDRAFRNRDMWKAQCERQAEELSRWRIRTSRDSLARHLAALDGITLHEIRSTVVDPQDANNWREYLGRADDLLAFISEGM